MSYGAALPEDAGLALWRDAARRAISHRIAPEQIDWGRGGMSQNGAATGPAPGLFASQPLPDAPGPHQPRVPQAFLTLAQSVIWHSDPARFGLLYQALWQLDQGRGQPLSPADALGRRLGLMAKAVRRDIHKMHAFVRFREMPGEGARRRFGAWFEPDHHTLEPGSTFFVRRFADMDWMIATPRRTAVFRAGQLSLGPPGPRPDLPEDASEALWATYFANIFNPARVKLAAMRAEMPRKYWKNLPETRLIPDMLADAQARVSRMQQAGATTPRPGAQAVSTRYRATMPAVTPDLTSEILPETLDQARASALQCRRCPLCEAATQTVWGEGDPDAALMIVAEQPGDHEDLTGRPMVGPAGQLLRGLMDQAGLDPSRLWLTNAVKHFKFTPRGKRRLHQNPNRQEIQHCRWWLGLELALVQPRLTLALGASAALALTGDAAPLSQRRGRVETGLHGGPVLISWHPARILRLGHDGPIPDQAPDQAAQDPELRDQSAQEQARAELLADLARARTMVTPAPHHD